MKVLVTGANGFLGHWVTQALSEQGLDVFALVREKSDLSELKSTKCQLVHGDVTELESLQKAFREVDSVFHLAGVIGYKPSERPLMEKVNVGGTANVLRAVRDQKVRKLVHLSSVVAVGAGFSEKEILNENSRFNVAPLHLGYFDTKKAAEDLVLEAWKKSEVDVVLLNPSTIYGAGDAKKGSRKTQIKVARGEFKFYTSGGVNVVAVEDVVAGILSAWKKGRSGERYILSSENLSIQKLFQVIAQAAGVEPPSLPMPDMILRTIGALGDLGQKLGLKTPISSENATTALLFHWFDSSKAQRELDFRPRSSEIAIQNSVRWMKENGYLNR